MAEADHDLVDAFLVGVLQQHKAGKLALDDARSIIAEAIALAANDENLVAYMRETADGWDSGNA